MFLQRLDLGATSTYKFISAKNSQISIANGICHRQYHRANGNFSYTYLYNHNYVSQKL